VIVPMFQKDYWSMDDKKLERLARQYNIPPFTFQEDPELNPSADEFFDRARVISQLVARAAALQANWALIISLISIVAAIVAVAISLISLKARS
jgi:hypothetical protein